MKICILKLLDWLTGNILISSLPSVPTRSISYSHRYLIIRPGGIGDAVLLIPALILLRRKFPDSQITVLAENRNCAVFTSCPAISNVLCYDNPKELLTVIRDKYDVVIDTEQWHRLSAVVARMTGASVLIGFSTNERKKLFNFAIPYSLEDYEVESFYHLLEPMHIEIPKQFPSPFLHITPSLNLWADTLLLQLREGPIVVIFPGASISEKQWGIENYRQVVELLEGVGVRSVLIGGKEAKKVAEKIVAGTNGLNLVGKTSLVESMAVIANGAVFLSGDSGVLHIAVALGKPTISLFGPSSIKKWSPKGDDHIVINSSLKCSPCSQFGYIPNCKLKAKCMLDITVDKVFAALLALLQRQSGVDTNAKYT